MDKLNIVYSILVTESFGMAGRFCSILVDASIFIAAASVSLGFTTIAFNKTFLCLAAACLLYFVSGSLIVITHWGDNIAVTKLFNYLAFFGLAFLWSRLSYTDPKLLLLAAIYGGVVCAFFLGGWAIFQTFIQPIDRVEGLAGNTLPFATVASTAYFLSLIGIVVLERKTCKFIAMAGLFLAMFAIFTSQSRTMFPVIFLAPLIIFILVPQSRKLLSEQRFIIALCLSILLMILNFDGIISRFYHAINYVQINGFSPSKGDSMGIRYALWTCASQEWSQNFWFGRPARNN